MRAAELAARIGRAAFYVGLTVALVSCSDRISTDQVLAIYDPKASYPSAAFRQPLDGTVVPPDISPLTFSWEQSPAQPHSLVAPLEV